MKEITISRNSWHYYIATKVTGYIPYYDNTDICTYRKHVLIGLVLLAAVAAIFVVAATAVIHLLLGIVFSLVYGAWIFSPVGEMALIISSVIGGVSGLFLGTMKLQKMYREYKENKVPSTDGFVKQAYKSWKEKYCVNIKFVDGYGDE